MFYFHKSSHFEGVSPKNLFLQSWFCIIKYFWKNVKVRIKKKKDGNVYEEYHADKVKEKLEQVAIFAIKFFSEKILF